MRMLRVLSIVLAVVVSGCELVTDPNDDPRGTRLPSDDFSARLVQSGDAPLPELLIRGGDGHVAVEGAFVTPVPCYTMGGWARVRGRTEIGRASGRERVWVRRRGGAGRSVASLHH